MSAVLTHVCRQSSRILPMFLTHSISKFWQFHPESHFFLPSSLDYPAQGLLLFPISTIAIGLTDLSAPFLASLESTLNSSRKILSYLFTALGIKPKFLPRALDPVNLSDLICYFSLLLSLSSDTCLLSIFQTPKLCSHLKALLSTGTLFLQIISLLSLYCHSDLSSNERLFKSREIFHFSHYVIYHPLLFSFVDIFTIWKDHFFKSICLSFDYELHGEKI